MYEKNIFFTEPVSQRGDSLVNLNTQVLTAQE